MNSPITYLSSADCLTLIPPFHFYNLSTVAGTFPVLWQKSYFFMSLIGVAVSALRSEHFVLPDISDAVVILIAVSFVILIVPTIESWAYFGGHSTPSSYLYYFGSFIKRAASLVVFFIVMIFDIDSYFGLIIFLTILPNFGLILAWVLISATIIIFLLVFVEVPSIKLEVLIQAGQKIQALALLLFYSLSQFNSFLKPAQ